MKGAGFYYDSIGNRHYSLRGRFRFNNECMVYSADDK